MINDWGGRPPYWCHPGTCDNLMNEKASYGDQTCKQKHSFMAFSLYFLPPGSFSALRSWPGFPQWCSACETVHKTKQKQGKKQTKNKNKNHLIRSWFLTVIIVDNRNQIVISPNLENIYVYRYSQMLSQPPELELQAGVNCLRLGLVTKLRSSARRQVLLTVCKITHSNNSMTMGVPIIS